MKKVITLFLLVAAIAATAQEDITRYIAGDTLITSYSLHGLEHINKQWQRKKISGSNVVVTTSIRKELWHGCRMLDAATEQHCDTILLQPEMLVVGLMLDGVAYEVNWPLLADSFISSLTDYLLASFKPSGCSMLVSSSGQEYATVPYNLQLIILQDAAGKKQLQTKPCR